MPGDDARTAFSFDYELEADDVRAWIVADRSIRKRCINNAGIMTVLIIVASVLTVTTANVNHRLASCPSLVPRPEALVGQWTCDTASPSDLVSQYALLFAGDVLFWFLAIGYAVNTWRLTPRRLARTWLASPGVAGRYRHEVAADGVTTVGPDGTRTLIPGRPSPACARQTRRSSCSGERPRSGTGCQSARCATSISRHP